MKSIEVKFNEALAAIKKAGRDKQYMEATTHFTTSTTIEAKLNAAEAVLKDVGVVRAKESAPVRKNNGTSDNFVENNPLRPAEEFVEGYVQTNTAKAAAEKSNKLLADHMLQRGEINEAQHRTLLGLKPVEYDRLTEAQKKEYDFSRKIGISEADSLKLAKMTGNTFREVSRR